MWCNMQSENFFKIVMIADVSFEMAVHNPHAILSSRVSNTKHGSDETSLGILFWLFGQEVGMKIIVLIK